MVQSAQSEADRILSEARKRAQEWTTTMREQAKREVQEILFQAESRAEQEKQVRLAAATAQIEQQVNLDEQVRQQAVAAVVRCVCG